MTRLSIIICAALTLLAAPLFASEMTLKTLATIKHNPASLTVVALDGTETSYSPAQLEEFTTYSLTTTTPWRKQAVEFDGILLADILAQNGLDNVDTIVVTAENDYQTSFSRELLDSVEILIATRANGKAHSLRDRGPIQFVIEANAFQSSALTSESNFVWMAARIEAAD